MFARIAVVVGVLAGSAVAGPSSGWPSQGMCLPQLYQSGPCVQLGRGDVDAIRAAVHAFVGPKLRGRPDWKLALSMIDRPASEAVIGNFLVETYQFVGFHGDVIRLTAVIDVQSGVEHGFHVTLGRKAGAWSVLHFERYTQPLPKPL